MFDAWKLHSVNKRRNSFEIISFASEIMSNALAGRRGSTEINVTESMTMNSRYLSFIMSIHWSRDKIVAILHMPFSNAFSWTKITQLFPRVQLTICLYGFWRWLGIVLYKIACYIGSLHILSALYIDAGWFECLTLCSAPTHPICKRSLKS